MHALTDIPRLVPEIVDLTPPSAPQERIPNADDIATAMEMLSVGIDELIIYQLTGVNHVHIGIAEQFGFDAYKPRSNT